MVPSNQFELPKLESVKHAGCIQQGFLKTVIDFFKVGNGCGFYEPLSDYYGFVKN